MATSNLASTLLAHSTSDPYGLWALDEINIFDCQCVYFYLYMLQAMLSIKMMSLILCISCNILASTLKPIMIV